MRLSDHLNIAAAELEKAGAGPRHARHVRAASGLLNDFERQKEVARTAADLQQKRAEVAEERARAAEAALALLFTGDGQVVVSDEALTRAEHPLEAMDALERMRERPGLHLYVIPDPQGNRTTIAWGRAAS